MARRFQATWTQADYQKAKKIHYRHWLMTKVVDAVLTSGLDYTNVAKRAGVSPATINRWVMGTIKNARIDTIMSVLGALNMEMVLVRKEAQDHMHKREKVIYVRTKSVTAS
jgi:predicted XRE-type DNA-binding protein